MPKEITVTFVFEDETEEAQAAGLVSLLLGAGEVDFIFNPNILAGVRVEPMTSFEWHDDLNCHQCKALVSRAQANESLDIIYGVMGEVGETILYRLGLDQPDLYHGSGLGYDEAGRIVLCAECARELDDDAASQEEEQD